MRKITKFIRHLKFMKSPALIIRVANGYFNSIIMRRNVLRSIELAVTYRCQASCHKCYAANLLEKNKDYLSIEQIRGIVSQAIRLGIIHINITGGEPTLRKDLFEIIDACRPREIMVSLVTNALALTREQMRLFKKHGLNTIQISLDSSDPNTHDKLRGVPGCFEKVMAAASWAREFGINLCFSTVLSTETCSNNNEMHKLLDLCVREKAFLLICDSAAVGGWQGKDEKMMTCQERNKALEDLIRHPNARHHSMYNFRAASGCPAGIEKIYITAYGDVTPCDLIHDSFGNVLKEDLKTIYGKMQNDPIYARKGRDCVRYLDEFRRCQEKRRS